MAIPRFQLYSSSPDGLAQLQRGYEASFLGADQSNREAASRAAEINLRNFLQARAQDEAARKDDMQRREQLRQERMAMALKDRSFSEDRRQFDIGADLKRFENRLKESDRAFNISENRRLEALEKTADKEDFRRQGLAAVVREFRNPRPASSVDFGLLSGATGVPESDMRPIAERSDEEFAYNQAAAMNQQLSSREQEYINQLRKSTMGIEPPQEAKTKIREQLKQAIELESGRRHPRIQFNPVAYAWEVASTPAQGTATGTNSPMRFQSPDEVRAAVRAGGLGKDQAVGILRDQFGFK